MGVDSVYSEVVDDVDVEHWCEEEVDDVFEIWGDCLRLPGVVVEDVLEEVEVAHQQEGGEDFVVVGEFEGDEGPWVDTAVGCAYQRAQEQCWKDEGQGEEDEERNSCIAGFEGDDWEDFWEGFFLRVSEREEVEENQQEDEEDGELHWGFSIF